MEYKFNRGTNIVQGLWYTRKGKRFPASKIDRQFSYAHIKAHLAMNRSIEVVFEAILPRREGAYKHIRLNDKVKATRKNEIERSR